jgi:hypothetical protein
MITKQFHKQFHQNNGLWFYRTNQLYIAGKTTQLKLIENFHDTKLAGHQGTVRTLAKIRRLYYWPGINTDVANFVRTCDTCQRHSTNTQKLQSYLHPLPIPDQRFEDIGIDFAFLPTTKIGHNMVMVIVDRLTKLVMAIPCKKTDGAEEIAKHWIWNTFHHHIRQGPKVHQRSLAAHITGPPDTNRQMVRPKTPSRSSNARQKNMQNTHMTHGMNICIWSHSQLTTQNHLPLDSRRFI